MPKSILVTGAAGFIGSNLVDRLLKNTDYNIVGIDNFDDYYDPKVKEKNIEGARSNPRFTMHRGDVSNMDELENLSSDIDVIVHLAAKAGVRPSITRAKEYFDTNLGGTINLLEFAKKRGIRQFVLASSSSVYGESPHRPWREEVEDLFPVSPYAASKLSAEKVGYAYSYLHGIRVLALRLFSVYGPRQRPDLLISKFASLIEAGRPLPVYGTGESKRDFTYVEDVTKIITDAIVYNKSNYEVVNVGARRPAAVMDVIKLLSLALKKPYKLSWESAQAGDVAHTEASTCKLLSIFGPIEPVSLEDGIAAYIKWRQS